VLAALKTIHWGMFGVLLTAGLVGTLAALPFLLAMVAANPRFAARPAPPLPVLVLGTLAQSTVLLTIAVGVGLVLAHRVGLRIPLLQAWLAGGPPVRAAGLLIPALLWGLAAGVALVFAEVLLFARDLPLEFHPLLSIPFWKRLLAGVVYGGVTEELLTRLFLVSLLAWCLAFVWKTPAGLPSGGAFWGAIVVAALLFGALHLPATAAIAPLTPMLVLRALLLNGIAGVVFGFLFWRYGLETAMLAHASAHLVLQGPGFVLIRAVL
jgi:hypothetical protein